MTLEVKGSSSSRIMICANDTSLSFTPMEFAIITGLNCVPNSGRYKDFPWGSLTLEDLARSLNNWLKAGGKFYLIQGMPLAIEVWLYECCSNVPPNIALKVENRISRLLNWKTIAPRPCGKSTIPMMYFGIETVEDENWFYTMEFPDQSWTDSHIDVCFYYLRKKSKYDPNKSYKFSTVDCNFMKIIRSVHDIYSADAENLTAGGHVAHLNEYINGFHMHVVVPWHTVEDIYIPVNMKKKHHWVLSILCFSERCIFLYDSYESSGHYSTVLGVIEKLAVIIPLCLEHCDFYVKKGIHLENHPRYKDKDPSDMFDVLFQESLPQQPRTSVFFFIVFVGIVVYIWLHMRSVFLMVTKFLRMSSTPMYSVQDMLHFCGIMGPKSLPGALLYFGGSTILLSTLSGISQSSLCGNG
ncbi:hypothetical protein CQW23_31354 [Capsicum baccatum]|uniref:Ubiquitin-like protease family profile domain-containing protein n=1 Tax=Capsicum baccatum TaxID=33114 RepID=A0A2G2V7X4_CAPBA|nr:hypothetical protein CQW23_31354 [Capsicum baccatum]